MITKQKIHPSWDSILDNGKINKRKVFLAMYRSIVNHANGIDIPPETTNLNVKKLNFEVERNGQIEKIAKAAANRFLKKLYGP